MQANNINAAQVLMSFMAKEQDKIGQKVSNSSFLEEVQRQNRQLSASKSENANNSGTKAPASSSSDTKTSVSASDKRSKLVEAKVKSQLRFTNRAVLEQVLGQIRATADTRQACENAKDPQGNVSMQTLLSLLSQQKSSQQSSVQTSMQDSAQGSTATQNGVSAKDVKSLLDTIQNIQGQSSTSLDQSSFGVKSSGTYSYDEFQRLMGNVVNSVSNQTIAEEDQALFSRAQAGKSNVTEAVSETTLITQGSDQPQRLANSVLPSFTNTTSPDAVGGNLAVGSAGAAAQYQKSQAGAAKDQAQLETAKNQLASDAATAADQANTHSTVDSASTVPSSVTGTQTATIKNQLADLMATTKEPAGSTQKMDQAAEMNTKVERKDAMPSQAQVQPSQNSSTTSNPTGSVDSSSSMGGANPALTAIGSFEKASDHGQTLYGLTEKNSEVLVKNYGVDRNNINDSIQSAALETKVSEEGLKTAGSQGSSDFSSMGDKSDDRGNTPASTTPDDKAVGSFFNTIADSLQNGIKGSSFSSSVADGKLSLRGGTWVQDLGKHIHDLTRQDRNHITLELDPENLGHISLRIETKNDQVTAMVSTDNAQVRELLLNNSSILRQHLENEGLSLGQLQVDVRQGNSGNRDSAQTGSSGTNPGNFSGVRAVEKTTVQPNVNTVYSRPASNQRISVFA